MLEEVVPKVNGGLVIHEQLFPLGVVPVAAVEDIERGVVCRGGHVLYIIFHFEFDGVAFVIFSAFELLVSVLLGEALPR